jgi:hypothetical protein
MKRAREVSILAFVAATMLATGCGDGGGNVDPTPGDPLVARLIALGFRGDMIEDHGDYFVVEGDIVFSKTSIPELPATRGGPRPEFQWRTPLIVGQPQVQTIKVNLAGLNTQPAWQTAARSALTEWNSANCSGVHLVEGSPANIAFLTFTGPSNVAARAAFPSAGSPGGSVSVNTAYSGSPNTGSTKLRNMVHEIGHTIGFRHTNLVSLGEPADGAVQVPGTPTTDNASIMNGNTATQSWFDFSTYDLLATRTLYPGGTCILPNFSGHAQVWPYNVCTWSANPTGGTPPYLYSWMGTAYTSSRTFGYSTGGSDFTMKLIIKDAAGRRAYASEFVHVYQYGPACG